MARLAIEAHSEGSLTRLELSGEFDMAGVGYFEDTIRKVESGEPPRILIDLTDVEFMDSSGLRAIVTANDRAETSGRALAVIPGPKHVRRIFEVTQLDKRLELLDEPPPELGS